MNNKDIIYEVNNVRAENKLVPLKENSVLDRIASDKSNDMCAGNYWSHNSTSHEWTYFFDKEGYKYINAGENLAKGYNDTTSLINAWVNSPEHYSNIVGKYTDIGSSILLCSDYIGKPNQYIVVNEFGAPYIPKPEPVDTFAAATVFVSSIMIAMVLSIVMYASLRKKRK